MARRTRSGVNGSSATRAPTAANTALAITAPPGITGGSPTGLAPYGPMADGTSARTASHPGDVHPRPRAALGDGRFALAQHRLVFGTKRRAEPIDVTQGLDFAGHTLHAHFAVNQLQVLDRCLQLRGGHLQHAFARFLGRL